MESAWNDLINSNGSDEHLTLCNSAMLEIQHIERARVLRMVASQIAVMVDSGLDGAAVALRVDAAGRHLQDSKMSVTEAFESAKASLDL